MCMNFSLSRREAAVIGIGAVIFSPLILLGALGYGAVAVSEMAIHKAKEKLPKGAAIKNRFKMMQHRMAKKLGRDVAKKQIALLTEQINQPNSDHVLKLQRASLEYLTNSYDVALQDLIDYLAFAPENVQAHVMKGHIHSNRNEFDAAQQEYLAALEHADDTEYVEPDPNADPAAQLPTAIQKQDVFLDLAGNVLRRALTNAEFKSEATVALLHQAAQYIAECEKTKAWNPNDVEGARLFFMRGVCKYSLYCQERNDEKLLQSALIDLSNVARNTPNAEAESLINQIYQVKDMHAEARIHREKAREIDPRVFVVDAGGDSTAEELFQPWPLPAIQGNGVEVRERHDWTEKTFHKPTWCVHCTKFVKNYWRDKDFECKRCGARAHAACKDQVATKCVAGPH